jgi:hypothetical protein
VSARVALVARLQRAARMTLTLYALQAGCAALLLWPVLGALDPELPAGVRGARFGPAEAALLAELGAREGRPWLFWALGCLAGWALLAPLLALAWLHALARSQPVLTSVARAASGYLPALALAACALCGWAVGLAAAALLLRPGVAALLPHSPAIDRAWTVATIAPVILTGLLVSPAHDLARARLALGAGLAQALRFAISGLTLRLVGQHALLFAAALGVAACAETVTRLPLALPGPVVLALQQALVLGAMVLRAAWLAIAVLAGESDASPAPSRDGDLDPERLA